MDISDQATEREEQERASALSVRRPAGPLETGACLNCGRPMEAGRRWCGVECRDDWQQAQRVALHR